MGTSSRTRYKARRVALGPTEASSRVSLLPGSAPLASLDFLLLFIKVSTRNSECGTFGGKSGCMAGPPPQYPNFDFPGCCNTVYQGPVAAGQPPGLGPTAHRYIYKVNIRY